MSDLPIQRIDRMLELNDQVNDDINKINHLVGIMEDRIRALGFPLTGAVLFDKTQAGFRFLCFGHYRAEQRFYILTSDKDKISVPRPIDSNSKPWDNCSRSDRFAAMGAFPELYNELMRKAEAIVAERRKITLTTRQNLEALLGVSPKKGDK